jgi:phosphonate transport system substrate-binding protein
MLRLTSIQAPNQDFIIAAIAAYLEARLGLAVAAVLDVPWQERERLLDAGEVQIGWICGLPYVRKASKQPLRFELLAAPVMRGERYLRRPIYFSDVVVRSSSHFHSFADLRGASWAYNEPGSHSGYSLTRYHLAMLQEKEAYFSSVVAAGSHQAALALVLQGRIDASAIDSTVLEQAIRDQPAIGRQIRIVETFGPSPIPPLVIGRAVPSDLAKKIRELVLTMQHDPTGQKVLQAADIARFVLVSDADYDMIREMERLGRQVHL